MKSPFMQSLEVFSIIDAVLTEYLEKHRSSEALQALEEIQGVDYRRFLKGLGEDKSLERVAQAIVARGNVRQVIQQLGSMTTSDTLTPETSARLVNHTLIIGALLGSVLPINSGEDLLCYISKFKEAGKSTRLDDLGRVLEEFTRNHFDKNGKFPPYTFVIEHLQRLADARDKTIQEVDDDSILWRKKNGAECTTAIKQLKNRLTTIRKKIRG